MRRRKKRQAKAYERIYAHIDDERLREMMDSLPDDDRRGTNAWALVMRECDIGTSDLEIIDLRRDFQTVSIESDVGYTADSIIMFSRLLNSLNARLPSSDRYDDNALSIKILSNIISPDALALEAVKELCAAAGSM